MIPPLTKDTVDMVRSQKEPAMEDPFNEQPIDKEPPKTEPAILEPIKEETKDKAVTKESIQSTITTEANNKETTSNESLGHQPVSNKSGSKKSRNYRRNKSHNKSCNQKAGNAEADGDESDTVEGDNMNIDSRNAVHKKTESKATNNKKANGKKVVGPVACNSKVDGNKEGSKADTGKMSSQASSKSIPYADQSPEDDTDASLPLSSQVTDGSTVVQEALEESTTTDKDLPSTLNNNTKGEGQDDDDEFKVVVWSSEAIIELLLLHPPQVTRNILILRKSASETDLADLIEEWEEEFGPRDDTATSAQQAQSASMSTELEDTTAYNNAAYPRADQTSGSASDTSQYQNLPSSDIAAGQDSGARQDSDTIQNSGTGQKSGRGKDSATGRDSRTEQGSRGRRNGGSGNGEGPAKALLTTQHRHTLCTQPAEFAVCTHCLRIPTGGLETQIICPGCGSDHYVRYCSVACLLADSYDHAAACLGRPVPPRLFPTNLPQPIRQSLTTIIPNGREGPERFRQRAFSMFCSTGPFPKILLAWARKMNYSLDTTVNANDWFKKTGDYAIFRSDVTGQPNRYNPNADVIFT
jgi:hypothetical protein